MEVWLVAKLTELEASVVSVVADDILVLDGTGIPCKCEILQEFLSLVSKGILVLTRSVTRHGG